MIFIRLLVYFILTCLIEGGTILLISKNKKYIYYSLLCNMLTNPALNYILVIYVGFFGGKDYNLVLAALEIIVVAVETVIYKLTTKDSLWKSVGMSLACNVASLGTGLLL